MTNQEHFELIVAQRDALLAAAKAAEPYLKDRVLNDYIDVDNVRAKLRQAIAQAEKE